MRSCVNSFCALNPDTPELDESGLNGWLLCEPIRGAGKESCIVVKKPAKRLHEERLRADMWSTHNIRPNMVTTMIFNTISPPRIITYSPNMG